MTTTNQHLDANGSRQRLIVILGAIIIGYAVTFAEALAKPFPPYSTPQLAAIIIIGLVYSYLLVKEDDILGKDKKTSRLVLYFLVMLALLSVSFWLVETLNGIWLIAMPFIGTGVTLLPRLWGWLLALTVFISMLMPVIVLDGLDGAFGIGVSLAPAIIFVIIFVRLWINAEEARQRTQKLADQLETANHQLSAYATQAEELATTRERNRVAREIHDSLGHYLTVINVQIEAGRTIMTSNPEQASDVLKKAQTLTQEGLTAVRQSVSTLRESPLRGRPLDEAIDGLAEETRNAGLVTEFDILGDSRPLEPNTELTLYRAVQEGLTNVRKHARASRVDITLDYTDTSQVCLSIKDNGIGAQETSNGGFGLLGVQERVKLLEGELSFDTSPGSGLTMTVRVPT